MHMGSSVDISFVCFSDPVSRWPESVGVVAGTVEVDRDSPAGGFPLDWPRIDLFAAPSMKQPRGIVLRISRDSHGIP